EPARRYATASDLAMDLQRYLANQPVVAGPPSGVYRLRKFVQRHRGLSLAASLLLLGALVGTVIAVGLMFPPRPGDPPPPAIDWTPGGSGVLPAIHRFTDATEESGLAAMLRQHDKNFKDWSQSGTTLLDIDGDGQLDLHL